MAEFTWNVLLPGADLPREVKTDYLVSDGEEIEVDGQAWVIERVDIDDSTDPPTGMISVIPPNEPAL